MKRKSTPTVLGLALATAAVVLTVLSTESRGTRIGDFTPTSWNYLPLVAREDEPVDFRGLVPDEYLVENAPGPYATGQSIWFNMWITNVSSGSVEYTALGTWVEETGQFQKSWTHSEIAAGQQFAWRDYIRISNPGTYHLWLRICFSDGACFNMLGPVTVAIQ